jgi:FkbM family methyltransferase
MISTLEKPRDSRGRRRRVNPLARLASAAILGYLRHVPLERGKYRLMRLFGPSLLVELEPGLFIRPLGLSAVEVGIIRRGMFEPETVRAFAALLAPGMTVLDVGANVGQFTLVAARRLGPTGRVHAFEPTPELVAHVLSNLELNGLDNVVVNEVAVSDATGHAVLHLVEADDPGVNSIVNRSPGARTLEVPTVSLDDYLAERGVGPVDVIKIDIEGAEMPALRGARDLLTGDDSPVLVLEFHPTTLGYSGHSPDDLLGLLNSNGYAFYPIAVYSLHTHDPYLNGIAAKPDHFDRFPALRRWQQRPLTTWDPALLATLTCPPLL